MKLTNWTFLASLTASSLLLCTGCFTVIGAGIGSALDANEPDTVMYTSDQLYAVGTNLQGHLRPMRGADRTVTIIRPSLEDDVTYRARVTAVCSLASPPIPVPPETVRAVIGRTLYPSCILSGYSADGIWFAPSPERQPFHLPWDRISVLRSSNGRVWTGDELRSACSAAQAPSRLGLLVQPTASSLRSLVDDRAARSEFIPAADIRTVTVPHRTYKVVWGLIAGLAVDLTLSSILLHESGFMNFGVKSYSH